MFQASFPVGDAGHARVTTLAKAAKFRKNKSMARRNSQLRHDYKPQPEATPAGSRHLVWFLAGVVLPVALLGLYTGLRAGAANPGAQANLAATALVRELPLPDAGAALPEALDASMASDDARPGTALILRVASGDSLDALFSRNKLDRADLARILTLKEASKNLAMLRPGDLIHVRHEQGRILELRRPLSEILELKFARDKDTFIAEFVSLPVETRVRHARAQIESSLFMAALNAGMSEQLTMNLAGIFAWDIDFVLDIRTGDSFTVIYQEIWQDGEFLRDGEILAAEFVNEKKTFRAIRYEDPNGDVGYYTPDGHNMRKAFLRAPVDFTRVSSRFNPRRLHPVYKKVRAHKGVDYAAPTGTPIRAAGDGKVVFRGRKGGYGNAVILQHGGNITTLYAHMSRFAKPRVGTRVKQGQIIGYVGRTGTATAAHLHYEYRINGAHRNPRTVSLPKAKPVPGSFREDFISKASPLLAQLDLVNQTRLAAKAG